MPNTASKVLTRFLQAKKTQNILKLEALFETLNQSLRKLPRFTWGNRPEAADFDTLSRQVAIASKDILKELVITADSPRLTAIIKKNYGKIRNFLKLLEKFSKADSWAELEPILQAEGTKTKDAWIKVIEYEREVIGLIGYFDSEVEETVHIGPYTVILMATSNHDWTRERVETLKEVLSIVGKRLNRFGMGSLVGGTVYAYAGPKLHGSALTSHNALASYNPNRDTLNLAIGNTVDGKLIHTVLHELGHRAHFKLVEGRSRTAWVDFFEGGLGTPDIDSILKAWEGSITSKDPKVQNTGRYLGYYLDHLEKSGNSDDVIWLNLLADQLKIKEDFDPYTGAPKKNSKPGLDQFIERRNEAKVFLYPITAYSGTSADELFAETFAEYATAGGGRVHPLVEHAFRETLPQFKMASTQGI